MGNCTMYAMGMMRPFSPFLCRQSYLILFPMGFMYGIFTYIYHKLSKCRWRYQSHGSYGFWKQQKSKTYKLYKPSSVQKHPSKNTHQLCPFERMLRSYFPVNLPKASTVYSATSLPSNTTIHGSVNIPFVPWMAMGYMLEPEVIIPKYHLPTIT